MWASIVAFLTGPLGKIVGYVAMALAAWGAYELWEYKTERAALDRFNKSQIEQVLKDRDALIREMEETRRIAERAQEGLRKANEEMERSIRVVEEFLNSPDAVRQDKPASPLLRDTIRKLGGAK